MFRIYLPISFFAAIVFLYPYPSCSSPERMNAPESNERRVGPEAPNKRLITSSTELVLQKAIRIFQERISPIDGPRCGFQPTCSRYGHEAIKDNGPLMGGLMTVDRLFRCNPWKRKSGMYEILPDGRLSDGVGDNVLFTNK